MKITIKKIISLLIGVIIFSTCLPENLLNTVKADHVSVRVAFYPLDGFFEYDSAGNETGYGVELLDKISQYTGINFEYVKAESWESTKQMLLDGEADLRMPATMPASGSTTLSYSSLSIIDTYHVLLALKSRNDLYYQDYENIKKIKIAVSESFYTVTSVKLYLDQLGITEDQLIFCNDYNDSRDKLVSGEADALVSNIMDMEDNMKMLARFNSISNYFTMTFGNPIINTLDEATIQIKLDEPLFFSKLYEKWFPERIVVPLTLDESEYLSSIDELTFAFHPDEGYLSRLDNGEYRGIYVEMAKYVCEKLGVKMNAVSIPATMKPTDSLPEVDIYSGFFYDQNYADKWNFSISSSINNISYYIIQKKEKKIDESSCRVAAVEKFKYTKDYLQNKYRPDQFVYCDTYEECLLAIENDKADIAVMNNYIAEYYLELYQFSDLSPRLTTEYSHLFCYAVSDKNEVLASILTKTFSAISNEELNQLYIKGMEEKPQSSFFDLILYTHPLQFAGYLSGPIILIIFLFVMILYNKNSRKQNRILTEALSAKSEFLARMSHDMRTPLNAVLGFAALARDEKNDIVSIQDYIKKMQSSGEYLLGLINDVLDASKIENGKAELNLEIVRGPEFLQGIADEFKAQAALNGITLVTDFDKADTPYVYMDKLKTRQIYSNLLNNAFKFSQRGSTVEWKIRDTMIDKTSMEFVSEICDHGCGMSKEFMTHMFEPFTQEQHSEMKLVEGTGLGLMIVKRFVEMSGGTIDVTSELGVGTTFTLHMKRIIPDQKEIQNFASAENSRSLDTAVLDGKRILMCEDHPMNREIAVRMLKKAGVITECAENGQIGTEMFRNSAEGYYDAVLMDMRMPVMNGLEAARSIRSLQRADAAKVPIIAVTANAYEEDIKAAINAGMNAHLSKPINPQQLYKVLCEYITQ